MESGYAYPERSEYNPAETCENVKAETDVRANNNITVFSEVSRSHSKPETSSASWENSQQDEGLNVRMAKRSGRLWQRQQQPKHISELPLVRISRKLKVKREEELSQAMQPMRTTPGRKFFLVVVCLKKS